MANPGAHRYQFCKNVRKTVGSLLNKRKIPHWSFKKIHSELRKSLIKSAYIFMEPSNVKIIRKVFQKFQKALLEV